MRHNFKIKPQRKPRRGFSLLEVLLALALTVVIFSAIASAIQVHLVSVGKQQKKIEQKQIARNLLAIIGNDLRAAIQYKAADYTGLENLAATQAQAIQAVIAPSEEVDSEEDEPETVIDEENVSYRPTLNGSSVSIAVDISRLPRLDQYLVTTGGQATNTPADIKSVGYFFSESPAVNEPLDNTGVGSPGGLYRREIDRAVAAFRGESGSVATPDIYCRLLAPEVSSIGFRYFDGTDWLSSWDSEENDAFPTAVEIQVRLDPLRTSVVATDPAAGSLATIHRTVVHLPIAEPSGEGEE